jgi:hypothetical protein
LGIMGVSCLSLWGNREPVVTHSNRKIELLGTVAAKRFSILGGEILEHALDFSRLQMMPLQREVENPPADPSEVEARWNGYFEYLWGNKKHVSRIC